ncbi:hypothetical protein PQU92_16085 [Asticcacaulis sp. BYS171W]|uniref:Uncharacterized protein n=1 Tax=Asticcacaulis aquaticus TaxID=2984212 RepID=A0ABT5HXV2_9CAUL|nr:hypothetical protein [Asticcacaulis aquaticus]MDC7684804.1 hypothetical protein [Asticcacaulis aquaticus]
MADETKPLSDLVAQGWEVLNFSTSHDASGLAIDNFLLRKQKMHRILSLRAKMMGKGYVATERDV